MSVCAADSEKGSIPPELLQGTALVLRKGTWVRCRIKDELTAPRVGSTIKTHSCLSQLECSALLDILEFSTKSDVFKFLPEKPCLSLLSLNFFFGVGVGGWQYYRTVPLNVVRMECI